MKVPGIGQRTALGQRRLGPLRRFKKQGELGGFAVLQVGGVNVGGLVGDVVTERADGKTELDGFAKIAAMIGAPRILKLCGRLLERLEGANCGWPSMSCFRSPRRIGFAIAPMQTRPVRFQARPGDKRTVLSGYGKGFQRVFGIAAPSTGLSSRSEPRASSNASRRSSVSQARPRSARARPAGAEPLGHGSRACDVCRRALPRRQ